MSSTRFWAPKLRSWCHSRCHGKSSTPRGRSSIYMSSCQRYDILQHVCGAAFVNVRVAPTVQFKSSSCFQTLVWLLPEGNRSQNYKGCCWQWHPSNQAPAPARPQRPLPPAGSQLQKKCSLFQAGHSVSSRNQVLAGSYSLANNSLTNST